MNSEEIETLIGNLPADQKAEAMALLIRLEEARRKNASKEDFLQFVMAVWPDFIMGDHHKIMADAFNRVARGELKRLIINMPPRHTKSEFASYLFPAWYLGKFPRRKVIQASNTGELAVGFGRKVRNLINSREYNVLFPDVTISADSKAAGRWNTNMGGTYFATGVGGTMTGIGADILMIDDPHSEQDAQLGAVNPEIYDKVYEWYTSGPRQRLQPGGSIIVIQTRWSKRDLTGQILRNIKGRNAEEWEVIELPAILPSGNPLWPGFWPLRELEALRDELPISKWMAQYQQQPTSEAGALIKREMWQRWLGDRPPRVEAILMSWDTAFEKTSRADPSACTVWGVFNRDDPATGQTRPNLILLYAWSEKVEFPELKKKVKEMYIEWEPDQFIIEKKASGAPLIYELRAMGVPVMEFTPTRGQDKISRVNAVTDIFASGFVWAPETYWAEEVIEQCASFPNGDHDDYVDTTSQALLRFRQGGWIRSAMDDWDEEPEFRQPLEYY